jgi:transposase
MRPAPPAFPLRRSAPRPWRPLTDIEWAALSSILHRSTRGRPPTIARYTWDAIFWVACSTKPWRALPEHLGKADSAHRALRRAARQKHLHRMLLRVSDHPEFARNNPLRAIEWFIVRAYRRAFRITRIAIPFARRLGLACALPAEANWLPDANLSETAKAIAARAREVCGALSVGLMLRLLDLSDRAAGQPWRWRTTG